jgi:L-2-hydroxyglutarate oxidase LhgO
MVATKKDGRPVVVIGAGVVGLACARALARAGHWVLVLEREGKYGRGTSSRSSGVIHAGIYYRPGSLKAALCLEGRERLYAYALERGVPHRRCGKLIVATSPAEIPELEALRAQASANGVELEEVGRGWLRRRAPGVTAVPGGGLWSPETGIVDAHGFMDALVGDAAAAGADVVCQASVVAAEAVGDGWRLGVRRGDAGTRRHGDGATSAFPSTSESGATETIEAARVINAAGLYADDVARLVLPDVDARGLALEWSKGNYFAIRTGARAPVDCLVYPCPQPERHTLGVHLTLDLDGAQRLGPDVEALAARVEDYGVDPGRAPAFLEAARRYLPHLTPDDLSPAYAGIRPARRNLAGYGDFHIAEDLPGWVNLVGMDSPGLTAALAIGRVVAELPGEG